MMGTDAELLRRYVAAHDEGAFRALVERHVDLVYSVARRQVGGDAHLAQDVTQRVFADLARKAAALASRPTLGGWLYRAAHFTASDLVRAERARRTREQEAQLMQELTRDATGAADWEKLRPALDAAINALGETERDAVVLRFFHARPYAEIGTTLRVSEDAARMRVERALEKLRTLLARRGVTSTSAALATALANQVSIAAPPGMAATVAASVLAGSVGGTSAAMVFMGMTKVQLGLTGALAAGFATLFVAQATTNASLRREIADVTVSRQAAAALRAENQRLASTAAEVETLRRDDAELKQLADRAAQAKTAAAGRTQQAAARTAEMQARFNERIRADDAANQLELDRMNREGHVLVVGYKELRDKSNDPALSPEARAEAAAAASAQLDAIKAKQREIQAFTQNTANVRAQRVQAFARAYGGDASAPPPVPTSGTARLELRRVPAERVPGGAGTPTSGP